MKVTITSTYVQLEYGTNVYTYGLNTLSYTVDTELTGITFYKNNKLIVTSSIDEVEVGGNQLTPTNVDQLLSPIFVDSSSGVSKDGLGLNNVDNTSDMDKPVSKAQQEAIDAITIGGRNYARNSKEITRTDNADSHNYYPLDLSEGLQSDTEYTLSIDKTEILLGNPVSYFTVLASNTTTGEKGSVIIEFPISASKQSYTFKTGSLPNDGFTLLLYAGIAGDTANRGLKWTNIKLEKGNRATDWTPAIEDILTTLILAQSDYDSLTIKDPNTIYYVY